MHIIMPFRFRYNFLVDTCSTNFVMTIFWNSSIYFLYLKLISRTFWEIFFKQKTNKTRSFCNRDHAYMTPAKRKKGVRYKGFKTFLNVAEGGGGGFSEISDVPFLYVTEPSQLSLQWC